MSQSRMMPILLASVICAAVMAAGCHPTPRQYHDLLTKHNQTLEILDKLEGKVRAARQAEEAWTSEKIKLEAERNYYKQIAEAGKETIEQLKALDADIIRAAEPAGLKISAPTEAGDGEITVSEGKIRILGEVLFATGSHELTAKGRDTIAKVAKMLSTPDFKKYVIRVDGHTDNQPVKLTREKYETNWMLGAWRAYSVLKVLTAQGIGNDRVFLASFGEYTPTRALAGSNLSTPEARRQCRRVEIALVAAK